MSLSHGQLLAILEAQLTRDERARAEVYVKSEIVRAGTVLDVPRHAIPVERDALIGFVDRQPAANWGHECRYIVVTEDTGDVQSFEARFPPWQSSEKAGWKKLNIA